MKYKTKHIWYKIIILELNLVGYCFINSYYTHLIGIYEWYLTDINMNLAIHLLCRAY